MSLEPNELGLVRIDDDASSYYSNELDHCNRLLTWLDKMMSSTDDGFGLGQNNYLLIRRWDPWMPLPPPCPDDDLFFPVYSPIEEPTSELEEADFTSTESPSSMDSLPFFETNSASYHSWYLCAVQRDLEENNVPVQQFPRVKSSKKSAVELPIEQPPTVEVPVEPERQIAEDVEEPLQKVAPTRVAVAVEGKKYPKPELSYPCLVALALKNCKARRLRVPEIYSFLKFHFPYFENVSQSWRKSVRRHLSDNECFKKIKTGTGGCDNKRGGIWEIESAHATKVYKDMRKKTKELEYQVRKAMRHPKMLDQLVDGVPAEGEAVRSHDASSGCEASGEWRR